MDHDERRRKRGLDGVAVAVAVLALLTATGHAFAMALIASDCHLLVSPGEDPCASEDAVRVRLLWWLMWVTAAAGAVVLVRALAGASRRATIRAGAAVTATSVPSATILAWDGRYPESLSVATVITGVAAAAFLSRRRGRRDAATG